MSCSWWSLAEPAHLVWGSRVVLVARPALGHPSSPVPWGTLALHKKGWSGSPGTAKCGMAALEALDTPEAW